MAKEQIGRVKHYFGRIGVAVIELSAGLKEGEAIEIGINEEDAFQQVVKSMQANHKPVEDAKKGDAIGIKVEYPAKAGAVVSRITEG